MTHIQSLAISKVSDVIHFFNPELEMKSPLKLSPEITSYDWDLRPRGCLISRDETPLKVPGLSSLSMNLWNYQSSFIFHSSHVHLKIKGYTKTWNFHSFSLFWKHYFPLVSQHSKWSFPPFSSSDLRPYCPLLGMCRRDFGPSCSSHFSGPLRGPNWIWDDFQVN